MSPNEDNQMDGQQMSDICEKLDCNSLAILLSTGTCILARQQMEEGQKEAG